MNFVLCFGLMMIGVMSGYVLCFLIYDYKMTQEKNDKPADIIPFDKPVIKTEKLNHYCYYTEVSKELTGSDADGKTIEYYAVSKIFAQMRPVIKENAECEYDPKTAKYKYKIDIWLRH